MKIGRRFRAFRVLPYHGSGVYRPPGRPYLKPPEYLNAVRQTRPPPDYRDVEASCAVRKLLVVCRLESSVSSAENCLM